MGGLCASVHWGGSGPPTCPRMRAQALPRSCRPASCQAQALPLGPVKDRLCVQPPWMPLPTPAAVDAGGRLGLPGRGNVAGQPWWPCPCWPACPSCSPTPSPQQVFCPRCWRVQPPPHPHASIWSLCPPRSHGRCVCTPHPKCFFF